METCLDKNNIRFTDGCLIGQDHEFIIKIVAVTTATAIPKKLLRYRIRSGSAIHAKWQRQKHIHAILGLRRAKTFVLAQKKMNPEHINVRTVFKQRIASQWFKLALRMIKKGYYNDALELLDNPIYTEEMKLLNYNDISLINVLKFKIVKSRNLGLWAKISKLGFL